MKITEENIEEVKKQKLKINHNKGFHITFKNGWTVSVQFGWGNYSDNYNNPVDEMRSFGKDAYASNNAEVWAWNKDKYYPEDPLGYQTPEQILKFMNKISKKTSQNRRRTK